MNPWEALRLASPPPPMRFAGVPAAKKPAIVTGAALHAFADAVDAGYSALSGDVIADQGDPMSGATGPRQLSRGFVEEFGRTAVEWKALHELLGKLRRGELPTLITPSSFWDDVEKYRQLLASFRERFASETKREPTGTLPEGPGWAAPAPHVPSEPLLGGGGLGTQVKDFAFGAAVLAAVFVGLQALRSR